jgi:hypothetical protein
MNLFNKLDPLAFILSLTIGFFIVYIFGPRPTILYKYPTPDNENKTIYLDNVDNCYQYHSEKVSCPTNTKLINKIPLQITS